MEYTVSMSLHAVNVVTLDWSWDWTVVIVELYVEWTSTDDVAVDVDNVEVVVVDRVDWVVEGRIISPLQFRVKTISAIQII